MCVIGNDNKGTQKNCDLRPVRKKNLMKYEVYSYFSIFVSNNIFVAPEVRNTERKKKHLSGSFLINIFSAVHGVIN